MSQGTALERSHSHIASRRRHFLRSPLLWLALVVLFAALPLIAATHWTGQTAAPAPADLFMQSVIKRDGNLGWHQLCPDLQAQEPLTALVSQVEQQRLVDSRQGLTLTVAYMGANAQPHGGQVRFYVVTGHLPDGWVGQRAYIVYTQASGCVEDVKNF